MQNFQEMLLQTCLEAWTQSPLKELKVRGYLVASRKLGCSDCTLTLHGRDEVFFSQAASGMSQGAQFEGLSAGDTIRLWRRRAHNYSTAVP
jgi:hypothetical protein